jgi:hypothetical protein
MRDNVWEGIGKELKIKLKFYVSSRDVKIVSPLALAYRIKPYTQTMIPSS